MPLPRHRRRGRLPHEDSRAPPTEVPTGLNGLKKGDALFFPQCPGGRGAAGASKIPRSPWIFLPEVRTSETEHFQIN